MFGRGVGAARVLSRARLFLMISSKQVKDARAPRGFNPGRARFQRICFLWYLLFIICLLFVLFLYSQKENRRGRDERGEGRRGREERREEGRGEEGEGIGWEEGRGGEGGKKRRGGDWRGGSSLAPLGPLLLLLGSSWAPLGLLLGSSLGSSWAPLGLLVGSV